MEIFEIAIVAHEANRMIRIVNGDDNPPTWHELAEIEKAGVVNGVAYVKDNPHQSPDHYHQRWMISKTEQGWVYGENLDREKKTHPNLRPWDELPLKEQVKDKLFKAIVLALS